MVARNVRGIQRDRRACVRRFPPPAGHPHRQLSIWPALRNSITLSGLRAHQGAGSSRRLARLCSRLCPMPHRPEMAPSFQRVHIDVKERVVFVALLLVLLSQPDHFAQDLDIEALTLGLGVDVFLVIRQCFDLLLEPLDAFDERSQPIACSPELLMLTPLATPVPRPAVRI